MGRKRLPKIIVIICATLVGIMIGITICMVTPIRNMTSNEKIEKEISQLVTSRVAIVNLDEGVVVQEEKVNYAAKLLTDLESNFLITGLEDARKGFESGIYAGYMVIPATFSESVLSLNDTPVRAELSYAINNNLREDVKEQIIYDIIQFAAELNSEVSYMYMHAVLDEFHDAQNQASTVMNHDLREKEAINSIEANDLVTLVPVSEISQIPYDIEPVDILDYMSRNGELTRQVGEKYTEYIMESETEHQKINAEAVNLMEEMGNMDAIISGIDLSHDEEGNSIYEKGEEELQLLFAEHNQKIEEAEKQIGQNVIQNYYTIQNYLREYDRAMTQYQSENEQRYLRTLNALQQLFESYQGNYVLTLSEEGQEIQEGEEHLQQTVQLTELQEAMQQILQENYYAFSGYLLDADGNVVRDENGNGISINSMLSKYTQNLEDEAVLSEILQNEVGTIERMDTTKVMQTADEKIMQPIQKNVDNVTTAITEQYTIEKKQLTEFQKSVTEYNPLKYINHEEIAGLTTQMFENGTQMSEAIAETDSRQLEYVANVYESTRNDLLDMKEDSDKAVADGLQNLKDIKNENSVRNQQIMLDFSKKLPYTRLGSLEYTQVYEFMINPVTSSNISSSIEQKPALPDTVKTDRESVKSVISSKTDTEMVIMLISVMLCGVIVFFTIKYHFHKNKITDLRGL